jgi:hypothetical protein
MEKIIANAFSLQMLDWDKQDEYTIKIRKIQKPEDLNKMTSAVGHADTAHVLGVEPNRINVKLAEDDVLTVAQIMGGRLPEGATTLPEGFHMDFFEVQEVTQQ